MKRISLTVIMMVLFFGLISFSGCSKSPDPAAQEIPASQLDNSDQPIQQDRNLESFVVENVPVVAEDLKESSKLPGASEIEGTSDEEMETVNAG